MNKYLEAQNHEREWWGNCANTLGEELKQLVYAEKMGLTFQEINEVPFVIDLQGKKVLDIGGGPQSLLLKTINGNRAVFDPCDYPDWVAQRYAAAGIHYEKPKAEDIPDEVLDKSVDEIWIYNVLQHTDSPETIVRKARRIAKTVRIFEWINSEVNAMHPHSLTEEQLNEWLGGVGAVEQLNGINGCHGKCYYGVFYG